MATLVPVKNILALWDPFKCSPWLGGRVTELMVRRNIAAGRLQSLPVKSDASAYLQAGRIAYLAIHGWEDPIQIDVGVPSMGCYVDWPIVDGNHRLAAARIRNDDVIVAEISGSIRYAANLLGVDEMTI